MEPKCSQNITNIKQTYNNNLIQLALKRCMFSIWRENVAKVKQYKAFLSLGLESGAQAG